MLFLLIDETFDKFGVFPIESEAVEITSRLRIFIFEFFTPFFHLIFDELSLHVDVSSRNGAVKRIPIGIGFQG